MHISPRALRQLAGDVDDAHRDGMRTLRDEMAELHFGARFAPGRRAFLRRAAVGGAAITFGSSLVPVHRLLPAAGAQQRSDTDLVAFAQSIELAIVAAYEAGAELLDPEVLMVAQLFTQHHQEHADVLGDLAGDAGADRANQALLDTLAPAMKGISGQAAMVRFARDLENQAVATYAFLLTAMEGPEAPTGVATILPIESAHATTLGLALGESPADLFPSGAFESADIAQGLDPAVFPVQA